ncbi:MAG: helix-turn-helix domain-containing protein [Hyphomicrobiaceae bacterium]
MGVSDSTRVGRQPRPTGALQNSVGSDIRALRKSRGMTLTTLARKLGRSVGFVSQIERGLSEPSIEDLKAISDLFLVPVGFFFGASPAENGEARHVVRSGSRRLLGNVEGGLMEELLSPDLGGAFEIIRSEFAAGAHMLKPALRDTEEAGYVVSGTIEIEINGVWHLLHEGDSFRFAAEPYRWRNRTDQPSILIWVIAPPTY